MNNQDIRDAAKESGVRLWELARKVGFSYNYFIVKLRHELSADEKTKLFTLIKEIAHERDLSEQEKRNELRKKSKDELIEMIMNR